MPPVRPKIRAKSKMTLKLVKTLHTHRIYTFFYKNKLYKNKGFQGQKVKNILRTFNALISKTFFKTFVKYGEYIQYTLIRY